MKKRRWLFLLAVLVLLSVVGYALRKPLARAYYVRAYEDDIAEYSAKFQVPESLICSVIWCESSFREDAESSAGACGLMQLTRETFGEVVWRLELPEDSDIFSPSVNIRCGTFYLHWLYTLYGNWETALAAYNAGMGNVNRWLEDAQYSADGKTLHTIPFEETAAYVQKVIKIEGRYRSLYYET